MVNKVDRPWEALLIFLSFSGFHAFRDGGYGMIWISNSSNMEKLNMYVQK